MHLWTEVIFQALDLVGCQLGVEEGAVALGEHVENQLDNRRPSV
jgi:hypothetical protein